MKKLFFIFLACFLVNLAGFSQDSLGIQNEGGRIQAIEIAFLTKRLNLSPEEAQRFWPIFNKYREEIRAVRGAGNRQGVPVIVIQQQVLDLKKKYSVEFERVLGRARVNNFFQAENDFNKILLRTQAERQQLRMQRRPNFRQ